MKFPWKGWRQRPTFIQLNDGWNAEPNAPSPVVSRTESDSLLLGFHLNFHVFPIFTAWEKGLLRFDSVRKFRLGYPNMDGWYFRECRYSKLAPAWGEFYEIVGPDRLAEQPDDWQVLSENPAGTKHFLFYFRDETFEVMAGGWQFEPTSDNALMRLPR